MISILGGKISQPGSKSTALHIQEANNLWVEASASLKPMSSDIAFQTTLIEFDGLVEATCSKQLQSEIVTAFKAVIVGLKMGLDSSDHAADFWSSTCKGCEELEILCSSSLFQNAAECKQVKTAVKLATQWAGATRHSLIYNNNGAKWTVSMPRSPEVKEAMSALKSFLANMEELKLVSGSPGMTIHNILFHDDLLPNSDNDANEKHVVELYDLLVSRSVDWAT
jgi:hypothetical protein